MNVQGDELRIFAGIFPECLVEDVFLHVRFCEATLPLQRRYDPSLNMKVMPLALQAQPACVREARGTKPLGLQLGIVQWLLEIHTRLQSCTGPWRTTWES